MKTLLLGLVLSAVLCGCAPQRVAPEPPTIAENVGKDETESVYERDARIQRTNAVLVDAMKFTGDLAVNVGMEMLCWKAGNTYCGGEWINLFQSK